MSAKDEIVALQWTVKTNLSFDQVIAEADQVLAAKDLPESKVKAAFASPGTYRVAQNRGVSADYRIVKVVPPGYGVIRIKYSGGESPSVQFQIIDSDLKRQRLMLLVFIPIPISPWYAPAMAEFRDASARLRARVSVS